jgi:hypothetical protein
VLQQSYARSARSAWIKEEASNRFHAKIAFKAAERFGAAARKLGHSNSRQLRPPFCPNAGRYPAGGSIGRGSFRAAGGGAAVLSAIWIALAIIFIGGERVARLAVALFRKLSQLARPRPAAARLPKPRLIGSVRWR